MEHAQPDTNALLALGLQWKRATPVLHVNLLESGEAIHAHCHEGSDCLPLVLTVHYDDTSPYDGGDAWPMFAATGDNAQACRAQAEAIAWRVETTLERGPSVARPE